MNATSNRVILVDEFLFGTWGQLMRALSLGSSGSQSRPVSHRKVQPLTAQPLVRRRLAGA